MTAPDKDEVSGKRGLADHRQSPGAVTEPDLPPGHVRANIAGKLDIAPAAITAQP
ncbi:hypothetical protein [Pseudooceanicola sp. C21-150M6]|uniref:hypothetical protein n=1 Tax=Pseudooceanicola sp. C21-150M6 TaxID=3434355 RepID=UPI003D7F5E15